MARSKFGEVRAAGARGRAERGERQGVGREGARKRGRCNLSVSEG